MPGVHVPRFLVQLAVWCVFLFLVGLCAAGFLHIFQLFQSHC